MKTTYDRELEITRLLNAPVDLVWKVFSESAHIAMWWGPSGFSNTIHKMEFKKGGVWEFVMHGPDGRDYKNKNVFKEIIKPELIVYDHVSEPVHTTTITFKQEGNKTLLSWNMLFESTGQLSKVIKTYKADEGLKQNLEKLDNYLKMVK